jgi:Cellulase M and related proteins
MDNTLLLDIFHIPSITRNEGAMAEFIKKYLVSINKSFETDEKGNIFNVSFKDKPLLSSHMDTVQDKIDAKLVEYIKIRSGVLSGYGVIGGDDKCGIYIMLDLLRSFDFNFIFSTAEESGGDGAKYFVEKADFSNILYGLVLDRRSKGDIICTNNNYGTKEFESVLLEIGKVFGYSASSGTFSDANAIRKKISCANLSVGYYNPHSKNEFVLIKDLSNALKFVAGILKNVNTKFGPCAFSDTFYNNRNYSYYGNLIGEEDFASMWGYGADSAKFRSCDSCHKHQQVVFIKSVKRDFCLKCLKEIRDEIEFGLLELESFPELLEEIKTEEVVMGPTAQEIAAMEEDPDNVIFTDEVEQMAKEIREEYEREEIKCSVN